MNIKISLIVWPKLTYRCFGFFSKSPYILSASTFLKVSNTVSHRHEVYGCCF